MVEATSDRRSQTSARPRASTKVEQPSAKQLEQLNARISQMLDQGVNELAPALNADRGML